MKQLHRRDVLQTAAKAGVGLAVLPLGKQVAAQTNVAVAPADLVAHWPFSSGFQDVSGDADATPVSGDPVTGSYDGRDAVKFDGADGLRAGDGSDNPELSFVQQGYGPVSFGGWVYFDQQSGGKQRGDVAQHHILRNDGEYVVRATPESGDQDTVKLVFATSGLGGGQGYNTRERTDDEMHVPIGEWHQFYFVLEAGNFLKFYLDGDLQFADDEMDGYSPRVTDYWSDQTIGSWYGTGTPDWYNLMVGKLSDLRVYKTELTDEQVTEIYQQTGGSDSDGPPSDPDGDEFLGRVVTPDDTAVSNGTVRVYSDSGDELLVTTDIGSGGEFSFTASELRSVEEAGTVNILFTSGDWFDGYTIQSDGLSSHSDEEWVLERELLYGPTMAESGSGPLGQVSVWRRVGYPDPGVQVISVEVTNTNQTRDPNKIDMSAYDLTSGSISISYDEDDVLISRKPFTDIDHPVTMDIHSTDTPSEVSSPEEVYHPHETSVPLAGTPFVDFSDLTITEQEATVNDGVGRIASTLPGVGTLLTVGDTLEWAFGDPLSKSASLGTEDPEPINPNEMDTVTLPWKSDDNIYQEASVVGVFPIQIESDEPTTIDVRLEWELESWILGFGTGRGYFADQVTIGPYE